MTLKTKHCGGCGKDKLLAEFSLYASGKPLSQCKACNREYCANWRKSNPVKVKEQNDNYHHSHGSVPATKNKACSAYLGVVVAETILSHEFPGFIRMPYGNKGYDYDCPKGFKIDVKSRCRSHPKKGGDCWYFHIKKNKKANFFLCIAFNDRDELLIPEHLWLIPGNVVNEKMCIRISVTSKSLAKWSKYERPLKNVLECCNKLRGE